MSRLAFVDEFFHANKQQLYSLEDRVQDIVAEQERTKRYEAQLEEEFGPFVPHAETKPVPFDPSLLEGVEEDFGF